MKLNKHISVVDSVLQEFSPFPLNLLFYALLTVLVFSVPCFDDSLSQPIAIMSRSTLNAHLTNDERYQKIVKFTKPFSLVINKTFKGNEFTVPLTNLAPTNATLCYIISH